MNILITGANGFIGHNVVAQLENIRDGKASVAGLDRDLNLLKFDVDSDPALLDDYAASADFIFHLAGINRPLDPSEFMSGNFGLTNTLLERLRAHGNTCPVMLASSIQAALDNDYGRSKKAGEDLLFAYGEETGAKILIYRFPNVFGKWSRPNYNSAVATFCHNIARDLPIRVNDPNVSLSLVYIDDVVDELVNALRGQEHREDRFCTVPVTHTRTLGDIVDLIVSFKESRQTLTVPDMSDALAKKLYATYLSFLPEDAFQYPLTMHRDERGSFSEIIRTKERGQFSVNITKPGITKGNHWHHTKNEKFLVVAGSGIIRFRQIHSDVIIEYPVSSEELVVVDIPVGYTHNIENTGDTDLVTIMWANEVFDPERPDTYFLPV